MRRRWMCVPMMLLALVLSACGGTGAGSRAEQLALDMRGAYLAMTACTASMEVTADYGSRVYDYGIDVSWEKEGDTVLTVTAPENIAGVTARLRHLRRRLLWREGFPHEIGLFLGYPPEDVQGFLADPGGGRCKLCGHWKVYHDVEGARRQFARFDCSREALCSRLRAGMTLSQLFGVRETPAA